MSDAAWQLADDVERRMRELDVARLSAGVRRIGLELSVRHIVEFAATYPGAPLVSVGGGGGQLEWAALGACVRVDPAPPDDARVAATAATVEQLVASHPELVGDCTLVCCRVGGDEDWGCREVEAVQRLRPRAVLALDDSHSDDHDAGYRFYEFLRGGEHCADRYDTVHTTEVATADTMWAEAPGASWVWLQRAVTLPTPRLPRSVPACEPGTPRPRLADEVCVVS